MCFSKASDLSLSLKFTYFDFLHDNSRATSTFSLFDCKHFSFSRFASSICCVLAFAPLKGPSSGQVKFDIL